MVSPRRAVDLLDDRTSEDPALSRARFARGGRPASPLARAEPAKKGALQEVDGSACRLRGLAAHVMKSTTTAVANLLNAARAAPDAPIAFAECFTFTATTGAVYTWTNVD